jgi:hypothetical protein
MGTLLLAWVTFNSPGWRVEPLRRCHQSKKQKVREKIRWEIYDKKLRIDVVN